MSYIKNILLLIICAIFLSCSFEQKDSSEVVVQVNGRKFLEEEIAYAYEMAPSNLTKLGKEKSLNIITHKMINRKLLADEAQARNLQKEPLIQRLVNFYEDAEIIRQLYLKHIRDSVVISSEEIEENFHRSNAGLLVKHYTTKDIKKAKRLYLENEIPEHIPLLSGTRERYNLRYGNFDSIEWNILDKRIEDILYGLPLGETSRPIPHEGKFHLFKVVDKEINIFATESEFRERHASIKSVIQKRKEHRRAFRFVRRIMKPEELVLKGAVLNNLAEYIHAQYQNFDRPQIKLNNAEINLAELKASGLFDSRVAVYKSGAITVSDFFFNNRVNPQPITIKSKASVRHDLADILAIYVRDRIFAQLGRREGLDENPAVKKEKQKWAEKILANKLKRELYNDVIKQYDDDKIISEKYQDILQDLVLNLRNNASVSIDKDKLYRIKTSDQGLSRKIDFFAKRL